MKHYKCFFKIQIRVCRITMQACGFASEPPPHREVIETLVYDIAIDIEIE